MVTIGSLVFILTLSHPSAEYSLIYLINEHHLPQHLLGPLYDQFITTSVDQTDQHHQLANVYRSQLSLRYDPFAFFSSPLQGIYQFLSSPK